jgi:hypothetical protein
VNALQFIARLHALTGLEPDDSVFPALRGERCGFLQQFQTARQLALLHQHPAEGVHHSGIVGFEGAGLFRVL